MKLPDDAFGNAAHTVLNPAFSHFDDGVVVFNRLTKKTGTLVFAAPHIGRDGLGAIGLLDQDGRLSPGVPPHRVTDVNLDRLVNAFAAISDYTFVGTRYSRLVVNCAVPEDLAIELKTLDGIPILAYQNGHFNERLQEALRLHRSYTRMLEEQIGFGAGFVGSLDTFTPERLNGDCGDERDMIVSIIASNGNMQRALALQEQLAKALQPHLTAIQKETPCIINPYEFVAINKPYGEQMHPRLADLQRGGITIEVRSDVLENPAITGIIAKALHQGIAAVYAKAPQLANGHDQRNNPADWQRASRNLNVTT